MRTSMIYPNIITTLPPEPPPRGLPDLTRLKLHDHEDDRHSHRRSKSRRRSRSRSRRRHRDDEYRPSARSTPINSPRKDVRFFDESPPPRSRRSVVPSRPKSFLRDAPPIAITETAKDTSRRLYSDHHRRHHRREDSSSSVSVVGSRPTSRATSRANSPVASRRPDPIERLRASRPGLDRGASADMVRRSDLAMTSNVAVAGGSEMLSPLAERPNPGHRRWHSKG